MHRATSVFLAVSGKKKVPLGLDIFQGTHLCLENDVSPVGFQSQTLWGLIPLVQVPRVVVPEVGHKPLTPQGQAPYL